jgi:acyl carrier protein
MDVVEQVRLAVAKTLKIAAEDVTPDTRLDEIGLNSLEMMELIFELEERFGIDIPFDLLDLVDPQFVPGGKAGGDRSGAMPFETVADVASAIQKHVGAKSVGAKPA